jgi:hypothetical protein
MMNQRFYAQTQSFSNSLFAATISFAIATAYRDYASVHRHLDVTLLPVLLLGVGSIILVIDDLLSSRWILSQFKLIVNNETPATGFVNKIKDFLKNINMYIFIFIDIAIALISYCLLLAAFNGSRWFTVILMCFFILGFLWSLSAVIGKFASNKRIKSRLISIMATHLCAAGIVFFYLLITDALIHIDEFLDDDKLKLTTLFLILFVICNRTIFPATIHWLRSE